MTFVRLGVPPVPVTVPLIEQGHVVAGAAPASLASVGGAACGEQSSPGSFGLHPVGRHPTGVELAPEFVAATLAPAVGPGVTVTVGAMVEVGAMATVAEALGLEVGSAGETPRADEVTPAVNIRLSRTDAPRRVTRDDVIRLPVLSRSNKVMGTTYDEAPRCCPNPSEPIRTHPNQRLPGRAVGACPPDRIALPTSPGCLAGDTGPPDAIELGLNAALPPVYELKASIGEFGRGERI
jgi:hypothetical protein